MFLILLFLSLLIIGLNGTGCPIKNCDTTFDGCNTCTCQEDGLALCTLRACKIKDYIEPICTQCRNNLVWNDCGSACFQGKECPIDSKSINIFDDTLCTQQCVPQCECPDNAPYYDPLNIECLTFDECFNDDDIPEPPLCPENCKRYFDGCNWCTCDENGVAACTKRYCFAYEEPYCDECNKNLIWNSCGDACFKDKTCDNPNGAEFCTDECVPQCECPEKEPLFVSETNECLSEDECPDILPDPYCPENCEYFYDGCNWCNCYDDGTASCTKRACGPDIIEEAYCIDCINNLIWNDCGDACFKDMNCDTPYGAEFCTDQCVPQCECPDKKPLYDDENIKCITQDECANNDDDDDDDDEEPICPDNCLRYFDGCNECICNDDGSIACTERACLPDQILEPECLECKNNLIWNNCGSACFEDKNCDNPNGADACIQVCVSQCECPSDKPLFDSENINCLSEKKCFAGDDDDDDDDDDDEEPQKCPQNCNTYFNGCQYCKCDNNGNAICEDLDTFKSSIIGHTKKCDINDENNKKYAKCIDCKNNLIWDDCGSACFKDINCYQPNGPDFCTEQCVPQCQCPSDIPLFDDKNCQCITKDECYYHDDEEEEEEEEMEEDNSITCPDYCLLYKTNDGKLCKCDSNSDSDSDSDNGYSGSLLFSLYDKPDESNNNCINDKYTFFGMISNIFQDNSKCIKCENNLEWQECPSCAWQLNTCKNMDEIYYCKAACMPSCACPQHTPIWDPDNHKCLKKSDCY